MPLVLVIGGDKRDSSASLLDYEAVRTHLPAIILLMVLFKQVTKDTPCKMHHVTSPAHVSKCVIRFQAIRFSRDSMFSNIVPSSQWDFGSALSNFSLFSPSPLLLHRLSSFSVEKSVLTMCTDLDVSPGDRQNGA